jgi:hypothetical protein
MLRKNAGRLGVEYDPKPPYLVLSTPDWSSDSLRMTALDVEDRLDISLAPEERPLLPSPEWIGKGTVHFSF